MFDSLKKWITEKGIKQLAPSLIRGAIKAAAGAMMTIGLAEESEALLGISGQIEVIVTGVLVFGLAQLWSWSDKPKKDEG